MSERVLLIEDDESLASMLVEYLGQHGVALALFGALAVAALVVLRHREPGLPRPYRVAAYPWIPVAYVAAALLIVGYGLVERPVESGLAAGTVLAGVPFYYLWRRP